MNVKLPAELKQFVEREIKAGRFKNTSDAVSEGVRLLLRQSDPAEILSGLCFVSGDVMTLVQTVMLQVARTNADNLRDLMKEMQATNNARSALRKLIAKVRHDIAENAGQRDAQPPLKFNPSGVGSESGYHRMPIPYPDPASSGGIRLISTDMHKGPIKDVCVLHAIRDELQDKLDGMNEMSEMTSLRLQMMMDRRSKFISTLSNIIKKISDAQDTLVQNLK